jgi:hypothetical protein
MINLFKNLFKKEEQVVKPPYYDIVCPFCFEKYEPDEVVFRATHHLEDDEEYALQEDEKLNKYRDRYNLDAAPEMEAILYPGRVHEDDKMYADNVLIGITDAHGMVTRKRLCPECHNELPINAGKVPSNIISFVGTTSVGKSIYMTSLIHTLQNTTAKNFNAACMPLNSEISRKFKDNYEDPVFERGEMLGSTRRELQEPFIFQLIFKDESKFPLTLVFFDVPGEGMLDQEFVEIFAPHIKNSAGILFLVDPLQFKKIRNKMLVTLDQTHSSVEMSETPLEPRDVILTLHQNFIGHQNNAKTNIPTAVVLTKSDLLQSIAGENDDYLPSNSNVFNNYVHRNELNLTEFQNINGEIGRFIENIDQAFKDAIDVSFTNTAYFAVSALGTNPVEKEITGVINPIRVDEPILWLLYELGYIDGKDY